MLLDESDAERVPVWTMPDRLAVRALEMFESSLCPGCQQDRQRSMNPSMAGNYQIHPHECYSCAALEQTRKGQSQTFGVKNYVVDAGPEELPAHPFSLQPIDAETYAEYAPGGPGAPAVSETVGL